MCSTKAVAESTNCSCARNPAQAYAEMKQEQPVTTWIITILARGVWAVLVTVLGAIAWVALGAWQMMMTKRPQPAASLNVEPSAPKPVVKQAQPVYSWDMSTIKRKRVNHG